MQKPANWETTNISNFKPVITGGHKCIIKQVTETFSQSGLEMLIVAFDMSVDDPQAKYYTNLYLDDKKNEKPDKQAKWKGNQYVITDASTQYGTANLKRFLTSVKDSNNGFEPVWGDTFCNCLKDKKIGVVFREEEYEKSDGSIGTSVKPFRFCNYAEADKQEIPKKKTLGQPMPAAPVNTQAALEGFMQVDSLSDEGLPFG